MSDVLDLSGADTSGFDPVDSGRYNVRIHKIEMSATKNAGKNPAGTPMVKMQLKIADGPSEGRIVFDQFVLPDPNAENAKATLGFFVRMLVAFGMSEEKVKSKGFNLTQLQDLVSKEAVATVAFVAANEKYDASNSVKGYKPAGSLEGTSGSGLL
jgi:hypothetical protein